MKEGSDRKGWSRVNELKVEKQQLEMKVEIVIGNTNKSQREIPYGTGTVVWKEALWSYLLIRREPACETLLLWPFEIPGMFPLS